MQLTASKDGKDGVGGLNSCKPSKSCPPALGCSAGSAGVETGGGAGVDGDSKTMPSNREPPGEASATTAGVAGTADVVDGGDEGATAVCCARAVLDAACN